MVNSLKSVTWPQVALVAILYTGTIAAHRWLGDGAAAALAGVTAGVALLLGRDPQ